MSRIRVKSALISVYHKDGLEEVVKNLSDHGVQIISTGGTWEAIKGYGTDALKVEDLTAYPSILGGRVKTLHPTVFGGILARREVDSDLKQMEQYKIPAIDLVIVDLYPFEATVRSGAPEEEVIEKIDIGGISLIRAAAKNFRDVAIISSKDQYPELIRQMNENKGVTTIEYRKDLATKAFAVSSHYDTQIFNYFNGTAVSAGLRISIDNATPLRYGENPHQRGVFYGDLNAIFDKLHGKELSYNNLLDIEAALGLIDEFNATTFAILKHNNACGIASSDKLISAWEGALEADPLSAFGGVLITNSTVDTETAQAIDKIFFEVIIAPAYSDEALLTLRQKKNRIILLRKPGVKPLPSISRSVLNGILWQDSDSSSPAGEEMKCVTELHPDSRTTADLIFAQKIVKHSKSNSIVLAKNGKMLASGVGQTSRVDALRQAIEKAGSFGLDTKGAVIGSDAFFPFADSMAIANKAGIKAVIQPGGSVRDNESVEYCNTHKMIMVFTGVRHFKH